MSQVFGEIRQIAAGLIHAEFDERKTALIDKGYTTASWDGQHTIKEVTQ